MAWPVSTASETTPPSSNGGPAGGSDEVNWQPTFLITLVPIIEKKAVFNYLENKLLLISINFTPKTGNSCLKKWYTYTRFSRYFLIGSVNLVPIILGLLNYSFELLLFSEKMAVFERYNYRCYKGHKLYLFLSVNHMGVSDNKGTPKTSILMSFPLQTIHFGVPLFLETPIWLSIKKATKDGAPVFCWRSDSCHSFQLFGVPWFPVLGAGEFSDSLKTKTCFVY